MFKDITWGILLDVTTKEKAQSVINRLANVTGEIEVLSLEPYWKDQSKYKLDCHTTYIEGEGIMGTSKFIFRLGIGIMVIGIIGVIINFFNSMQPPQLHPIFNVILFFTFLCSLFQGGLLIGIAKIIEILNSKKNPE